MHPTTAQLAMRVIRDRKKILALQNPDFEHIELITAGGFRKSKATLLHIRDELFVVYDWEPSFVADVGDDSIYGFNKQLIAEHYSLTLAVGTAVGEYMASHRINPPKVVYTGHGWGGALAVMQSFVVPPSYLVTFGQPAIGNHRCTEYLESKIQQKKHGQFVYDRYSYLKDPLARAKPFEGFDHIDSTLCNHLYINNAHERILNPSWFTRFWDGFLNGNGQAYEKLTYNVLMRIVT